MNFPRLLLIFSSVLLPAQSQSSLSDNVALFWNLYDSVVRGSRILHDVTEGVGAVSKAIKAIDTFLDTSAEEELAASIKTEESSQSAGDAATDTTSVPAKGKKSKKKTAAAATGSWDAATETCPPEEAAAGSESVPATKDPNSPKFDGCGALGFHIKDSNLPVNQMTDCCGVHDTCYSSACRVNKRDCDSKLRSCLFQVCDDRTLDRSLVKSCRGAAKLLFSGTMALSFQQYNEAQSNLKCSG